MKFYGFAAAGWIFVVGNSMLFGSGARLPPGYRVKLNRPVAAIMAPFARLDIGRSRMDLPDLRIVSTRPAPRRIAYRLPEATVDLRFEPVEEGAATVVYADVHIALRKPGPSAPAYDEVAIEKTLTDAVRETGENLDRGWTGSAAARPFADRMVGLALATGRHRAPASAGY